uniref:Uncharacterized protein n=1 Tax=Globodera rostochiensis TaxID=31243 RepID=A0A914HZ90_GLORO
MPMLLKKVCPSFGPRAMLKMLMDSKGFLLTRDGNSIPNICRPVERVQQEEAIKRQCGEIIQLKPILVFTEKGISDLAQEYLDGPLVNLEKATTVTVVLRGPSNDINENEHNIQDALHCVRKVRVVSGAEALEMALSHALEKANSIPCIRVGPYKAVAHALDIVPRTLLQNGGGSSTVRQLRGYSTIAESTANWTRENYAFLLSYGSIMIVIIIGIVALATTLLDSDKELATQFIALSGQFLTMKSENLDLKHEMRSASLKMEFNNLKMDSRLDHIDRRLDHIDRALSELAKNGANGKKA